MTVVVLGSPWCTCVFLTTKSVLSPGWSRPHWIGGRAAPGTPFDLLLWICLQLSQRQAQERGTAVVKHRAPSRTSLAFKGVRRLYFGSHDFQIHGIPCQPKLLHSKTNKPLLFLVPVQHGDSSACVFVLVLIPVITSGPKVHSDWFQCSMTSFGSHESELLTKWNSHKWERNYEAEGWFRRWDIRWPLGKLWIKKQTFLQ